MILYKYYSFDSGVAALKSGKLGFRNPKNFNDPFELSFLSNSSGALEKIDHVRGILDELRKNVAILSLTRNPRNPLMWAHYANEHTGFVIGYKVDDEFLQSSDCNIIPVSDGDVVYTNTKTRHLLNKDLIEEIHKIRLAAHGEPSELSKEARSLCRKIFLTKHSSWVYEEEVRVVKISDSLFEETHVYQSDPLRASRPHPTVDGLHIFANPANIRYVYLGVRNKLIRDPERNSALLEDLIDLAESNSWKTKKILMSDRSWS